MDGGPRRPPLQPDFRGARAWTGPGVRRGTAWAVGNTRVALQHLQTLAGPPALVDPACPGAVRRDPRRPVWLSVGGTAAIPPPGGLMREGASKKVGDAV